MNIVVLGMHRSGTSCITNLLNKMGCYFGPDSQHTVISKENSKGFWERRDMRVLCDYLLQSQGCDWWNVADFDFDKIEPAVMQEADRLFSLALDDLRNHRNWVLKEPRLCLLWPFIERHVQDVVYVVSYRNPLSVANSLKKRNNFPLDYSLLLWEYYTLSALKSIKSDNFLLVDYDKLVDNPEEISEKIFSSLSSQGAFEITLPNKETLDYVVDKKLRTNRENCNATSARLTTTQQELVNVLAAGEDSVRNFSGNAHIGMDLVRALKERAPRSTTEQWSYNPPKVPRERPSVDINVVSYNDAQLLGDVLEDLAGQTYRNISINVFDDCSSDESFGIATLFARKYPRCKVYRSRVNLGLVRNFNRAWLHGNADFVMLKSGNDRIDATYVEKLAEMLRANPSLGLAYARARLIKNTGEAPQEFSRENYFRTSSRDVLGAAATVMRRYSNASPIWGIFRRNILEACRPYPHVLGGDHVLACEASLYGDIDFVDEVLLDRQDPHRSDLQSKNIHNEDMPRGMKPTSIYYDQSFRVGHILFIYEHLDMLFRARIRDEFKLHLSNLARRILVKRYAFQIESQVESFVTDMGAFVDTLPMKSDLGVQRFLLSLATVTGKCLYVLPGNRALHTMAEKIRKRLE